MASEVSICNSALINIGATTITSLTQGIKNANACNEQYFKLRDQLLRAHNWNFAIKRIKLGQLSATPVTEFDFQYALPSDWLRTIQVHDNDAGLGRIKYKIEGGNILSDATNIYLRYVSRITDPNKMPADFQEVLGWRLAMALTIKIAGSNTRFKLAQEEFNNQLRQAKSTDALEDFPEEAPEGSWLDARHGGGGSGITGVEGVD